MRELVRDDAGLTPPRSHRRARRIEQQMFFAESHETGILHRAGAEVGDGDDVELVERVGDAEPLTERIDDASGRLEGEVAHRALALRGDEADGWLRKARRFLDLEVADRERDEVSRQRLRPREAESGPVADVF